MERSRPMFGSKVEMTLSPVVDKFQEAPQLSDRYFRSLLIPHIHCHEDARTSVRQSLSSLALSRVSWGANFGRDALPEALVLWTTLRSSWGTGGSLLPARGLGYRTQVTPLGCGRDHQVICGGSSRLWLTRPCGKDLGFPDRLRDQRGDQALAPTQLQRHWVFPPRLLLQSPPLHRLPVPLRFQGAEGWEAGSKSWGRSVP